ncbi:MAG: integration host factor subunit beta [Williamsia sp.]|nr:integration host factor subunit beta [Williamsia sp.]
MLGSPIQEALADGESIFIRGFGTFSPKKRAAKIGQNIKRGLPVHIPEHYIPHFKPAKEFKHKLKHAGGRVRFGILILNWAIISVCTARKGLRIDCGLLLHARCLCL